MRIAVIGGGIAGLGAAWALQRRHETVLYEAERRLGGHACTIDVTVDRRTVPVDIGFLVYNEQNYPQLTQFFATLGVETAASDMSFAVSIGGGRMEYAGSLGGLAAQPANLLRPRYLGMLRDVVRFYRTAPDLLRQPVDPDLTLGAYLVREGYGAGFVEDHLLPMGAAIWSCSTAAMQSFPAVSFVRFFVNHGLLSVGRRPQWRTVAGGSRNYVSRLVGSMTARIRTGHPVAGIVRRSRTIEVVGTDGTVDPFDRVVIATHADTALALLGQGAQPDERAILSAFRYETNRAVVHCSPSLMPRRRRLWSSWNYLSEDNPDGAAKVTVSYYVNRLQRLDIPVPIITTLNPPRDPPRETVFHEARFAHPLFDGPALAAQAALPAIQGRGGVWHCGAHCGNGFHEDGLQSGFAVAAALGVPVPWAGIVKPVSPAAGIVGQAIADVAA